MNGISHEPPEDEGLDPGLMQLFDAAPSVDADDAAFVSTMLVRLEKARRTRLIWRVIATAVIVVLGAILAPYVAVATLTTMGWLLEPETGVALASPIGCVCAALLAWRIARRRFS